MADPLAHPLRHPLAAHPLESLPPLEAEVHRRAVALELHPLAHPLSDSLVHALTHPLAVHALESLHRQAVALEPPPLVALLG